jgi:hypothetical protein
LLTTPRFTQPQRAADGHPGIPLPIKNGTIRAMDLGQIKTGPDDVGLMTDGPAFMNTASCRSSMFVDET